MCIPVVNIVMAGSLALSMSHPAQPAAKPAPAQVELSSCVARPALDDVSPEECGVGGEGGASASDFGPEAGVRPPASVTRAVVRRPSSRRWCGLSQHGRVILALCFVRLVLVPALCLGLAVAAHRVAWLRWLVPAHAQYAVLMMLTISAAPSAQMVLVLCAKLGLGDAAQLLSRAYIVQYCACVLTSTAWLVAFQAVL